ncbi:hypothetical protein ACEN4A_07365 [Latilactobacillus sakei]|uniref:hypothetical protein n=1 Tax=Latilactobacillus sakei TaxID=1599 RepID=UPI003886E4E1
MKGKIKNRQKLIVLMIVFLIVLGNLIMFSGWVIPNKLVPSTLGIMALGSTKELGIDLLVIVSAHFLINKSLELKYLKKLWLKSWIYSFSLTLLAIALLISVYSNRVLFQSLLPNLLNSNPIMTTILLLVLLNPVLKKGLGAVDESNLLIINIVMIVLFGIAPMLTQIIPSLSGINFSTNDMIWGFLIYLNTFSWIQLEKKSDQKKRRQVEVSAALAIVLILLISLSEAEVLVPFRF